MARSRRRAVESGNAGPSPDEAAERLPPERLAELRHWIAKGRHADADTDLLIATRILEQGDL
jgi:hypothetical protein